MGERAILTITIDRNDAMLFVGAFPGGWSLNTVHGSESSYRWATHDAIMDWLRTRQDGFEFKAFPDDSALEVEGAICGIVLGFLPEAGFFGYEGFECFWGGVVSKDELTRIFDTISDLRAKVGA